MLATYDDCVYSFGNVVDILDGDLRLSVRTEPFEFTALSDVGQTLCERMSKRNGKRHKRLGFVASITEHHALVACSRPVVIVLTVAVGCVVDAHCDVGRLLVDRAQHGAGFVIEAERTVVVADVFDDASYD